MNKAIIFIFVIVIYSSSCVLLAQSESLSARGSGTAPGSAPKKLRLLYNSLPSASRLYRLRAVTNGLDDEDLMSEDETVVQKRQYDDYGHMRFGKRGNPKDFDDYGHLRFGK